MSEKAFILEIIRNLPDNTRYSEIVETIAIAAALRRGEAAADKGKVVPHEEVRKRLAALAP